jgi:hypothetical protein
VGRLDQAAGLVELDKQSQFFRRHRKYFFLRTKSFSLDFLYARMAGGGGRLPGGKWLVLRKLIGFSELGRSRNAGTFEIEFGKHFWKNEANFLRFSSRQSVGLGDQERDEAPPRFYWSYDTMAGRRPERIGGNLTGLQEVRRGATMVMTSSGAITVW